MKSRFFFRATCVAVLWCVATATGRPAATAQEPPQETSVARAQALLRDIEVGAQDLSQLRDRITGLVGEDSALTAQRIVRRQAELSDLADGFVAQLVAAREAGQAVDTLIEFATGLLAQGAELRRERLQGYESRLAAARLGRATATGEDLLGLERLVASENTNLDREIADLRRLTEFYEPLGLDPQPHLAYFDSLVAARAAETAERIQLTVQSRDALRVRIRESSDEEAAGLANEMRALLQRLDGNVTTLAAMADLIEERGQNAAAFRQLLVSATGELTMDILDTRVALGLIQETLGNFRTWLITTGAQLLLKIILFLGIFVVFRYLGHLTTRLVDRALTTSKVTLSKLLKDTIISIAGKAVVVLGVMIGLSQVGVQLGPLLAGLGVLGFIVGFALQSTLSNFAAGFMIVIYRPFDVGDVVEAGGVYGKIDAMTLVSTEILTFDNQRLTVPNSKIWGEVIRNVTAETTRRVDLTISVGYSDNLAHAEEVLHRIVTGHPLVLPEPVPIIKVDALADSSVDFAVRPWCNTKDYWSVYWDLTRSIKDGLDAEEISIPFPQRDVHLYQQPVTA